MAFVREQYLKLLAEIKAVCAGCGRSFNDIRVLAATKYASLEEVNAAIGAGITLVGENKVQDAAVKFGALLPCKKHFIGHLQTNKVKQAVKLFDCIESVDSFRLAEFISLEAEKQHKIMPILLEVNIAADSKKFGLKPDQVLEVVKKISQLKFVKVSGLMTIVPFFDDAELARPFFREMKQLFDLLKKEFSDLNILSMGMSHDFKAAIQEGATMVRIGSYLFK